MVVRKAVMGGRPAATSRSGPKLLGKAGMDVVIVDPQGGYATSPSPAGSTGEE